MNQKEKELLLERYEDLLDLLEMRKREVRGFQQQQQALNQQISRALTNQFGVEKRIEELDAILEIMGIKREEEDPLE